MPRLPVGLACFLLAAAATPATVAAELSAELATDRAALAAGYLVRAERPDGGFVYEIDLLAARTSKRDHIVRQAGAAYGLALALGLEQDPAVVSRLRRALDFTVAASLAHEGGLLVSGDGTPGGAHAGATALSLLAELLYASATGEHRYAEVRAGWLRGLERLWLEEVGFASVPGSTESSPYYDGESWLALAHHARVFPADQRAGDLLATADALLIGRYDDPASFDVGFMHWGMLAAAVRYETTGDERFLAFGAGLAETALDRYPAVDPEQNGCSLVEGLAAMARVLEGGDTHRRLLTLLSTRIRAELASALELQVLPGQTQIDFGVGRFYYDEGLAELAGAFRNGRFDLRSRIDLTQHCLGALVGYIDWQRRREGE